MMNESTRLEKISVLLDGEIDDAEMDAVLANLLTEEGKEAWAMYHQVGDVLRSEDLAMPMSRDFSTRFAARFADEPVFLPSQAALKKQSLFAQGRQYFRFYMLVASATAAALFAFFIAPQWVLPGHEVMTQAQSEKARDMAKIQLASASTPSNHDSLQHNDADKDVKKQQDRKVAQVEMLRNPDLDSYLIAHQRFSPAISNGAQYVTRANAVSAASEK